MPKESEGVRFTVTVSSETAEKIINLAAHVGASESRMASVLLEEGLKDNEWIIRWAAALQRGVEALGLGKRPQSVPKAA